MCEEHEAGPGFPGTVPGGTTLRQESGLKAVILTEGMLLRLLLQLSLLSTSLLLQSFCGVKSLPPRGASSTLNVLQMYFEC